MMLNHLWGFYTHPKEEWEYIDRRHESWLFSVSHILLIALIPTICNYFTSTQIGWDIAVGDPIILTNNSALMISIGTYLGLVTGVFALAYLVHTMGKIFDADPTWTQSFELAAYTATPLFMVGFAFFLGDAFWVVMIGLAALSYSVYLLYSGVPILMHIPDEKGFIYSSSVVTCGLILFVILMVSTIIIWSMGAGPAFV